MTDKPRITMQLLTLRSNAAVVVMTMVPGGTLWMFRLDLQYCTVRGQLSLN